MNSYKKEIALSCIRYIEDKHFNSFFTIRTQSDASEVTIDLNGIKLIVDKDELVRAVNDLTFDYYESI